MNRAWELREVPARQLPQLMMNSHLYPADGPLTVMMPHGLPVTAGVGNLLYSALQSLSHPAEPAIAETPRYVS